MDLKLKNKVALIGGSSKGIGKGCAMQLASEGANVVICARNEKELTNTADYIRKIYNVEVLPIIADLSKKDDVNRVLNETIKRFKKIDILVINSGGPKAGKFFDMNENDWNLAYYSVLYYAIEMYYRVIPIMKENNWGRIINITSLTVKEPSEGLILSNVFRTGLVSLAKTISKELIANNITINNICPGAFKTDRAEQLISIRAEKEGLSIEEVEVKIVNGLPSKRMNTIDEIGDLVAFLSSDLASGITGTTIQLDGGFSNSLL